MNNRLSNIKSQIKIGAEVRTRVRIFGVKNRRGNIDNSQYIKFNCGDKDITLAGIYWLKPTDSFKEEESFLADVVAAVSTFQDCINLKVSSLTRVDSSVSDFLPEAEGHTDNVKTLHRLMSSMTKGDYGVYGTLTHLVLEEFLDSYISHPASKKGHHDYIGGLLEHSLETMELALSPDTQKEMVNLDKSLLVCSSLLHDIGKIYTLSLNRNNGQIVHSDYGKYLNHSICGVMMVSNVLQDKPWNAKQILHLQHIIGSHHGDLNYGAITSPMSDEAVVVNLADSISGRGNLQNKTVEKVSYRRQNIDKL